jgi:hypothetical protein
LAFEAAAFHVGTKFTASLRITFNAAGLHGYTSYNLLVHRRPGLVGRLECSCLTWLPELGKLVFIPKEVCICFINKANLRKGFYALMNVYD